MKKYILILIVFISISGYSQIREWNTSLDATKRLAVIQNKLILMMWEESTLYPMTVTVTTDEGKKIIIDDMFTNPYVNNLIWEYFIPVSVSESEYKKLYSEIKGSRSVAYINKFNDDSIKIIDVNGNILNTSNVYSEDYINITELVLKYALNTSLLKGEYLAYNEEQGFYSAYWLGVGYVDMAAYVLPKVRYEMIKLSNIYFDEAKTFLEANHLANESQFLQKFEIQKIKQHLMLNKPKKVLRQLNRLDTNTFDASSKADVAFMYFTAHLLLKDEKSASAWRSKVSLVNLKKANQIISANQ